MARAARSSIDPAQAARNHGSAWTQRTTSITLWDVDRETGPDTDGTGPAAPAEPRAGRRGGAARGGLVPAPPPLPGGLARDPPLPVWIARAGTAPGAGVAVPARPGGGGGLAAPA